MFFISHTLFNAPINRGECFKIGNRDYRRLIPERKLREMQPSTAALQVMGPRIATSLLLQSINLRPLFMIVIER